MAESQILTVIRAWAAVAWADGVLAEPEAAGLRRLILAAELTDEERTAAARLLAAPVEMPKQIAEMPREARHGIYRAACRLAVVDHMFTQTERTLLDKLRDLLEMGPLEAESVEVEIPGLL